MSDSIFFEAFLAIYMPLYYRKLVRIGQMRKANKILVENPERKNHSEDVGIDG
jgi:hypothetical protein